MLKHTSVGSSTPQVRNPSGLRKTKMPPISCLETMPFTYQIVKDTSQGILDKHQFYAWKRPAHLRPHWLVLSEKSPAILVDTRNTTTVWSLKFPYDTRQVQKVGPIICEAAYDSQEATLWIWDVMVWEKNDVWATLPYSERWNILQTLIRPMIHENHPMCDITIRYPEWMSLKQCLLEAEEPGYSYDFQPERAGQRRHVWVIPKKADTFHPSNFHERKMVSEPEYMNKKGAEARTHVKAIEGRAHMKVVEEQIPSNCTRGILRKDTISKLPDTYTITSDSGANLGLAAVRSMDMSVQLRTHFKTQESCTVELQWYESFGKYEVKRIL